MRKHLAIMNETAIEAVLMGQKTIETRFSLHKIAPFGQVSIGDLVFMKQPGKDLIGQFRVKKVFYFEGLTEKDVQKIWEDYGNGINCGNIEIDGRYQKEKLHSNYGTLIFITQSERLITSPLKIKKKDLRGWVVLS